MKTSKLTRGTCKRGPTRNLTLDVIAYKGIKAKLRKVTGDPLTDVTIDFNPGVCLYGHNGSVLPLLEFLDALAILVTRLKPLPHGGGSEATHSDAAGATESVRRIAKRPASASQATTQQPNTTPVRHRTR